MEIREFNNKEFNFNLNAYIDRDGNSLFKAIEITTLLGYKDKDKDKAIRKYVDLEDKETCPDKKSGQVRWCTFINESGLYSLILRSKLTESKIFKRWVTKEVLPSIRKQGFYSLFNNRKNNVFKIENEYDLHTKLIGYIKKFYPNTLLIVGLGELQDTDNKRIKSYKKGYQKEQPDLIITNLHKYYNGFCIEFKTPKMNGKLTESQENLLQKYKMNNYECLVSSDYDEIIHQITNYMLETRIKCPYCRNKKFRNNHTLDNHKIKFHRISLADKI